MAGFYLLSEHSAVSFCQLSYRESLDCGVTPIVYNNSLNLLTYFVVCLNFEYHIYHIASQSNSLLAALLAIFIKSIDSKVEYAVLE